MHTLLLAIIAWALVRPIIADWRQARHARKVARLVNARIIPMSDLRKQGYYA